MDTTLKTQLNNRDEIKAILKEVHVKFTLSDHRNVNTLLVYLPCHENEKSSHIEFFKCVKNGILQNFVFSCSEVKRKLGVESQTSIEDLFNKSLRKISQHTAKGELGELILFTLLDVYLNAPKLLSKVSMKSNPKMPVFAADAVHGQLVNGSLKIYFGESKVYKDFRSAANKAAVSIKNAKENYAYDFDLLDSYIDFPNLDENLKDEIISTLNPYSSQENKIQIHSPCFIGFTQPDILYKDKNKLEKEYIKLSKKYVADFFSKIENKNININEVTLIMLPFGCVDILVNEFISYLGIEK